MKKTSAMLIGFLFIGVLISCNKKTIKPSSDITIETRQVSSFSSIDVADALDVEVTFVSGQEQVTVEANSNLQAYLITEVNNGKLEIHWKKGTNILPGSKVKIYVNASEVSGVEASGASNIQLINAWTTTDATVELSGASSLRGNLVAESAKVNLSGASNTDLTGALVSLNSDCSGASNLKGFGLSVDYLLLELSGASNAELTVNSSIHLNASGASDLSYHGNASISYLNLSGSSTIHKY